MSEALIRELVDKIIAQRLQTEWLHYLLMLAIATVGFFLAYHIRSFAKRTGEITANEAKFEELQRQLRLTTTATEEIKLALNHEDWITREWRTLRRTKLEELLQAIYEVGHWQLVNRDVILFNSERDPGPSPITSVRLLSTLYFPELRDTIEEYLASEQNLALCVSINKPHSELVPKHLREEVFRGPFNEKWHPLYEKRAAAVAQIETRCGDLIHRL
jgi:hypothetical protein